MLHAPFPSTVAKLDISRLLESSPSPPYSHSRPAASQPGREINAARSLSDPPPTKVIAASSERGSISSTHSGSDSYLAPSSSSLPSLPQGRQLGSSHIDFQLHQQQQHIRARIPSLSSLPLSVPITTELDVGKSLHVHSLPKHSEVSNLGHGSAQKRPAQQEHASAPPAKRQSKWTAEEDTLVIELRGAGMKWEDISKRIPGRTPLSCRLHYQNYIERRSQWDEDRKNRLARLYERLKPEMWKSLAAELNVPWRAAEAMHWQLGQVEMARRAGVTPFSISTPSTGAQIGARADANMTGTSPTAVYQVGGSYAIGGHSTSAHTQPVGQDYFEEHMQSRDDMKQVRTRSVSVGSGHERFSARPLHLAAGWSHTTPVTPSNRQSREPWPLLRLPELENIRPASRESEAGVPPQATRQLPP